MIDEEKFRDGLELSVLIGVFLLSVISLTPDVQAGDNHVHIDQVGNGGDEVTLTIDQVGQNNEIDFSFAHSGNTIILKQYGANNKVSWVPYWGSGKSWGGDIDGTGNNLNIEQHLSLIHI